jgi:hypothetical protein
MNLKEIKKCAENLELLLMKYSKNDQEAIFLYDTLKKLISKAKQGSITQPIKYSDVPGDFYFTERNLRQYPDLESAYAKFKIEITGGKTDKIKALLKTIEGYQAKNKVS